MPHGAVPYQLREEKTTAGSSSTWHNCPRHALIYRQRVPETAPNHARPSMSISAESSGAAALATEPRVVPGKQAGRCVHKVHLAAALAGLGCAEDGLVATHIAFCRVHNRGGSPSARAACFPVRLARPHTSRTDR